MKVSLCLVVQHEMAVGERAALGVLTGQPDRDPILQQRGEGERLGLTPVDSSGPDRLAPALELAQQLLAGCEALGQCEQLLVQRLEPCGWHGRSGGLGRADAPASSRGHELRLRDRLLERLMSTPQLGDGRVDVAWASSSDTTPSATRADAYRSRTDG